MSETVKQEEIAAQIAAYATDRLCVTARQLAPAFTAMRCVADETVETLSCDGAALRYAPAFLIGLFLRGADGVTRAFLHAVFHCLFLHVFEASHKQPALWDVACDVCAEYASAQCLPAEDTPEAARKRRALSLLEKTCGALTAQRLYDCFLDGTVPPEEIAVYADAFRCDDHSAWYARPEEPAEEDRRTVDEEPPTIYAFADDAPGRNEKTDKFSRDSTGDTPNDESEWKRIGRKILLEREITDSLYGSVAGDYLAELKAVNRDHGDYRTFLWQFFTIGQLNKPDDAAFDYVYYSYGLRLYGNMPLIEPQERRETPRLRELVIAVDTSGSVQGEKVKGFIEKTYRLLSDTAGTLTDLKIHIVQCDAAVQSDTVITCEAELDACMRDFTLRGFGGTDFRPVFEYTDKLIEAGAFYDLQGLIYFTDGQGVFPALPPRYKTAFVIPDDGYSDPPVPPWAIKLILKRNELEDERIVSDR